MISICNESIVEKTVAQCPKTPKITQTDQNTVRASLNLDQSTPDAIQQYTKRYETCFQVAGTSCAR